MNFSSLTPSIIVVEDFFDDFERARAESIEAVFTDREGYDFAYRSASAPAWMTEQGVDKIVGLIGEEFRADLLANHLLLSTEKDWTDNVQRNAVVHFDETRWAAVVYLNTPEQCSGGTALYQHRATGATKYHDVHRDPAALRQTMADSANPDAWREVASVAMVPNRLVLFDPDQFHQATGYFGDTNKNARLIHNFFFRHRPASGD